MLLLSEGHAGEDLGNSQKAMLFQQSALDRKSMINLLL